MTGSIFDTYGTRLCLYRECIAQGHTLRNCRCCEANSFITPPSYQLVIDGAILHSGVQCSVQSAQVVVAHILNGMGKKPSGCIIVATSIFNPATGKFPSPCPFCLALQ